MRLNKINKNKKILFVLFLKNALKMQRFQKRAKKLAINSDEHKKTFHWGGCLTRRPFMVTSQSPVSATV